MLYKYIEIFFNQQLRYYLNLWLLSKNIPIYILILQHIGLYFGYRNNVENCFTLKQFLK